MACEAKRGPCRGERFLWRLPLVACLLAGQVWGATEVNLEYKVKAAFLLNFTRFVEWPPSSFADFQAPFSMCILGNDPFGHALEDVVQGENVNGRNLVIRRISGPPAPQTCQVLFVGATAKDVPKVLESAGKGVLTIGEGDDFLREGGMISFVLDSRRVRFDINGTASQSGGLKLSSKLLTVARTVSK